MKTLLALFLLATFGAQAQIVFQWDAADPVQQVKGYKLYEIVGSTTNVLGTTSNTTTITIAAWNFSVPHTVFLTATNVLGESPASNVVIVPPGKPTAPVNLTPKPLALVVPVPGVLEMSPDLQDWRQRIAIAPNAESSVLVSQVLYAGEPLQFWRVKPPYTPAALPVPR